MIIDGKDFGKIFLAPMAGVTDVGFRHVCKMCGADMTYTEMVSSKALIYDNQKTKDLLITSNLEKPVAAQIFGHEPESMAEICKSEYLQNFDLIDINFGCPAPKIVNNGDGSAILRDLKLLKDIVTSCVKATNKPISCKFRKGYFAEDNVAVEVAKICEDAGAKLITIHGRTKSQMYDGKVDLDTIANVKAKVKIPVVGNGDVVDLNSYNAMLQTGVDAVMIGRGSFGNPNIFAQLKNNNELDKLMLIKEHINVLRQHYNDKFINVTMKKHLLWYVAGIKCASSLKREISVCEELDQSLKLVEQAFKLI